MRTNCPNCGAVVDMTAKECAYCGTPYIWARQPLFVPAETDERPELASATMHEILTPNEMRARLGLPPVKESIAWRYSTKSSAERATL